MGNGSTDVDSIARPQKAGQPGVDRFVRTDFFELHTDPQDLSRAERSGPSGAMAQQSGDSGYQSAPQKLIHLVGCRDTKVCANRPHGPASTKR